MSTDRKPTVEELIERSRALFEVEKAFFHKLGLAFIQMEFDFKDRGARMFVDGLLATEYDAYDMTEATDELTRKKHGCISLMSLDRLRKKKRCSHVCITFLQKGLSKEVVESLTKCVFVVP